MAASRHAGMTVFLTVLSCRSKSGNAVHPLVFRAFGYPNLVEALGLGIKGRIPHAIMPWKRLTAAGLMV
jgi:hypothetical protein